MTENKDKEHYTRVTTILYPFSGLEKIDPEILQNAADRGTKVHKICEGIVNGLGELSVEPNVAGYVQSFKKWWDTKPEIVEIEKRFWNDDWQITGQVDFIIKTDDGMAIVDLKTSSKPSKTWSVQGNAYAFLARNAGYDIKQIFFIHLQKDGKDPVIYEYGMEESFESSFFNAVLRVWRRFFN